MHTRTFLEALSVTDQTESIQTNLSTAHWGHDTETLFFRTVPTIETLGSGMYQGLFHPKYGHTLRKINMVLDDLVVFPDHGISELIEEFQKFWQTKDLFSSYKLIHKRGFLLWGPPGSGKTSIINLMSHILIETYNGIILLVDNPNVGFECINMIRAIEPNRKLVVIFEDIDSIIMKYGETDLLSLLDGEIQFDSVVFVATTNYPEKLDSRITNRPSRFDTIKYIDMPTIESRAIYIRRLVPDIADAELQYLLDRTNGYSIAHVKELIISTRCLGKSLEETLDRLDELRYHRPSSDSYPTDRPNGFLSRAHQSATMSR